MIGLKKLAPLSHPIRSKTLALTQAFSRAFFQIHVAALALILLVRWIVCDWPEKFGFYLGHSIKRCFKQL